LDDPQLACFAADNRQGIRKNHKPVQNAADRNCFTKKYSPRQYSKVDRDVIIGDNNTTVYNYYTNHTPHLPRDLTAKIPKSSPEKIEHLEKNRIKGERNF
jgi:hypothetical protein